MFFRSPNHQAILPNQRARRSEGEEDHLVILNKSTTQKIKDLDARIDAINTSENAPVIVDALIKQTEPPFTDRVMKARVSSKCKPPTELGVYEGKTDPMDHLDSYKNLCRSRNTLTR